MHRKSISRDLKIQTHWNEHHRRSSNASISTSATSDQSPPQLTHSPLDFARRSSVADPESHHARTGVDRHSRSRASSISVPYNTIHRSQSFDSVAWSVSEDGDWGNLSESSATSLDWPPELSSLDPQYLQQSGGKDRLNEFSIHYGDSRRGSDASLAHGLQDMGIQEETTPTTPEDADLAAIAESIRISPTTSASDKARSTFVSQWLSTNYTASPENNVSRQALYSSYARVADQYGVRCVNSASFGKLIRAAFPQIKTRRLGVRGNSKYHYCGMRPRNNKEASILRELSDLEAPEAFAPNQLEDVFERKEVLIQPEATYAPLPQLSMPMQMHPTPTLQHGLPPLFPRLSEAHVQSFGLDVAQVFQIWQQFSDMCSSLLRSVKTGDYLTFSINFRDFFIKAGLDARRRQILEHHFISDLTFHALSIIYEACLSAMESRTFDPLVLQTFAAATNMARGLEGLLSDAMAIFSSTFSAPQIELAARFGHLVQLHLGICQIGQALRGVLTSTTTQYDLCESWQRIDFEMVKNHCALATNCRPEVMSRCFESFARVLAIPGGLNAPVLAHWLKTTLADVSQPSIAGNTPQRSLLGRVSFLIAQIMRDLTLRSDKSFGAFQLIALFCQDWLSFEVLRRATLAANSISSKSNETSPVESNTGSAHSFTFPPNNNLPELHINGQQDQFGFSARRDSNHGQPQPEFSPRTSAMFTELTFAQPTPQYATFTDMLLGENTPSLKTSMALTPMGPSWGGLTTEQAQNSDDWPSFVPKTPMSAGFSLFMQQQSQPSPPHPEDEEN